MNQDPFSNPPFPVVIPNLGTADKPIIFLIWLVDEGAYVIPGERIAEILVDSVLFHLESPQEGHIQKLCVKPDAIVRQGEQVAMLATGN